MSPEQLIEQVVGAFRERSAHGVIQSHPAWHDLDDAERIVAFDQTLTQRRLEVAADPDGMSATARAVLDRITRHTP